ncbi:hypothetical protein [Streptomyces sp. NPDC127066]|uniref:hypothetical protein n=1 Tax=Streptomyces sp. NPDC127066 TaxID=3347125 RepID=UPI003661AA6D
MDARLTILRSKAPVHVSTSVFDRLPILIDPPTSILRTVEKATTFIETTLAEELEAAKEEGVRARALLCTECNTLNDPRDRECVVCSALL